MKRRAFLQVPALAAGALAGAACRRRAEPGAAGEAGKRPAYPVVVESDAALGHLVREAAGYPLLGAAETDVLVVGGGLAGLAAAHDLHRRGREFLLCELSARLGGTSGARGHGGVTFCQGAHYDLPYPDGYGEEVLGLLEGLGIVRHDAASRSWVFVDRQHLIPTEREGVCYAGGATRPDVLPGGRLSRDFVALLAPFGGEMPLPTRLISARHHSLESLTFLDYLREHLAPELPAEFVRAMDYQMLDDYGGEAGEVSALAGVHYHMCRPYYAHEVEHFSPPEGNFYFVRKLARGLPGEALRTGHLVTRLVPAEGGGGFRAEVIDAPRKARLEVRARQVVYAGQKHALRFVFPDAYPAFAPTRYAPWLVVNLVLREGLAAAGLWQNEILGSQRSLIGFVDSAAQAGHGGRHRVLTAYFCFPPAYRAQLVRAEEIARPLVGETVKWIEAYFQEPVGPLVEAAYLKVMGHAMPVPVPGSLFRDPNAQRPHRDLVFAGVDTGRLPLLYEALDSGLLAARALPT